MGVPFNEHSSPREARQPPPEQPDHSSSDEDESQEDLPGQGGEEVEQHEWYSSDDSGEWEDPSEGQILTLAMRAAEHGHEAELSQLLPQLSVAVDTPGPDGDTALHLAALYGHLGCARMLLEHGHSASVVDDDGAMPLHDAAAGGYLDVTRLLLEKMSESLSPGESVNAADHDGDTPCHNAARGGFVDVVRVLLEAGADPTLQNLDFKTPAGLSARGSEIHTLLQDAVAARAAEGGSRDPAIESVEGAAVAD